MTQDSQRSQQVFVVRIWQETSSATPLGPWRGSIEHLGTGKRRFFADWQEIVRFVNGALAPPLAGAAPDTDRQPAASD